MGFKKFLQLFENFDVSLFGDRGTKLKIGKYELIIVTNPIPKDLPNFPAVKAYDELRGFVDKDNFYAFDANDTHRLAVKLNPKFEEMIGINLGGVTKDIVIIFTSGDIDEDTLEMRSIIQTNPALKKLFHGKHVHFTFKDKPNIP